MFTEDVLETLRGMARMDFNSSPAAQFMGAYRRALIAENFTVPDAEAIAVLIDIELPQGCMTEEQVNEVAVIMASIAAKIYAGFASQGFSNPIDAVIAVASKFHLKFS